VNDATDAGAEAKADVASWLDVEWGGSVKNEEGEGVGGEEEEEFGAEERARGGS
jgi:hypothetical protein